MHPKTTSDLPLPASVLVLGIDYDGVLVKRLRADGVYVQSVKTPPRWNRLRHALADVIVIDERRNQLDGLGIVRTLRTRVGFRRGVFVLSDFTHESGDRVCAYFDSGADGVVGADVCIDEIVARLRALLRRFGSRDSTGGTVSNTTPLSTSDRTASEALDGHIPLTMIELSVIGVLTRYEGKVVSRERLLRDVWGLPADAKSNVVGMCISSLRRKLHPYGPDVIRTVRGVGFSLNIEISI